MSIDPKNYDCYPIKERNGVNASFEIKGKKASIIPTEGKDFSYIQSIVLAFAAQRMYSKLGYLEPIAAIDRANGTELKKEMLKSFPEYREALDKDMPSEEILNKETSSLNPSEQLFYSILQSGVKGAYVLSNKDQFRAKLEKLHFLETAKKISFVEGIQGQLTTQSILETRLMRKTLLECTKLFAGYLGDFPEATNNPKTREWTPRTVLGAVDVDLGSVTM